MAKQSESRTLKDYVQRTIQLLSEASLHFGHGTDNARDEAAWLVTGVCRLTPEQLETHLDRVPTASEIQDINNIVEARIRTRKPAAYLLHEAWFAGRRFYVDERVIVPRSHIAEFIREQFQPWIEINRVQRILDLCTGCGCMAIAAAYAFPGARVDASDVSPTALEVAHINVKNHGLTGRVQLVQSDLFEKLTGERYDLIISNPPYVDLATMQVLPEEYRHEPAQALVAGPHGLDAILRILGQAQTHLSPAGLLVMETGNSGAALQQRYPHVPFVWLTTSRGDESVFLLTAEQLAEHHSIFANNSIAGGP